MKKVLGSFILVLAMSLLLVAGAAAKDSASKVDDLVELTNDQIQKMVDKAVEKAAKGNQDIEKIIEKLQDKSAKQAEKAKAKAEDYGAIVECDLVEVTIGDQVVLIDPLIIIGWGRD